VFLADVVTEQGSRSDEVVLIPIGDIHLGARACDTDALKATIEEVKRTPNAFWLGMGDYSESITISDKRFDLRSVEPTLRSKLDDLPNACLQQLVGLFSPIKDKCLGLLVGNHEETLRLRQSQDIHSALCVALSAKNLGYDALIRWKFRRGRATSTLMVFASHSTIAGRKDGAKVNRMMDVTRNFDADLYLFGHGHSQIASRSVELSVPESGQLKLKERLRIALMTGTYRKTYQQETLDYSEKMGCSPTPIGSPRILIRPWAGPRHRFEVVIR